MRAAAPLFFFTKLRTRKAARRAARARARARKTCPYHDLHPSVDRHRITAMYLCAHPSPWFLPIICTPSVSSSRCFFSESPQQSVLVYAARRGFVLAVSCGRAGSSFFEILHIHSARRATYAAYVQFRSAARSHARRLVSLLSRWLAMRMYPLFRDSFRSYSAYEFSRL